MTERAPLLRVDGLCKRFGALLANDQLSFTVQPNEIHALIGPNGAGKTTALAQISGELRPDSGTLWFNGRAITHLPPYRRTHLGLARTYQINSLFPDLTLLENALLALQPHEGHSFRFWRSAHSNATLRRRAGALLDRVALADLAQRRVGTLAYGHRRQLEVALALAGEPTLLLLDEPLAGMGRRESEAMVALLALLSSETAVVLIEHDLDAVFTLAHRVTVLDQGRVIASATPQAVRRCPAVQQAYLG